MAGRSHDSTAGAGAGSEGGVSAKRKREEKARLIKAGAVTGDKTYTAQITVNFNAPASESFDDVCRRLFALTEQVSPPEKRTPAYMSLSVYVPVVAK
jgi:hypothetical protein